MCRPGPEILPQPPNTSGIVSRPARQQASHQKILTTLNSNYFLNFVFL
jgi:hypothetical protein